MNRIKTTALLMLAALSITANVYAAPLEPNEVIKGMDGDQKMIQKVYVLPVEEPDEPIPTDNFVEDGDEYSFVELRRRDNFQADSKEHVEAVTIKSNTNDTQSVIAKFGQTKEVSTDDGYTGTLEADFSTLNIESSGYGEQSYTLTETRVYPNLSNADTSAVPKSITKDDITLELVDIDWNSASSDSIDGQSLTVMYTANATYSGVGTRRYSKGYIATVEYKGTVNKSIVDTVTYIAFFKAPSSESIADPITDENSSAESEGTEATEDQEGASETDTQKKDFNPLLLLWLIPILGVLGAGGYAGYRFIRMKKKGY